MESGSSLRPSREPVTCPYPEEIILSQYSSFLQDIDMSLIRLTALGPKLQKVQANVCPGVFHVQKCQRGRHALWSPSLLQDIYLETCGSGSSVSITTDYGLDCPALNLGGDEIFRPSRPVLGPTQHPVQWVPGCSRGQRRPGRGADSPSLEKSSDIPLLTLRACMAYKKGLKPTFLFINIRDRQKDGKG